MFKGFYQLTSGMLSQGRRLDVVSHNMTNISTAGYKAERYTDSTFEEVMISRVGNKDKTQTQEIGQETFILAPSRLYTDYEQGAPEETTLPLDFCIQGEGFFAISRDGEIGYTRSGAFTLDDEGYLCLAGQGRVLDNQGQEIGLPTDDLIERGLYVGQGAALSEDYTILHGFVERSNVNMVQEMVAMMTTQRALQSAAQITQIYDQVITRATTELGRLG